MRQFFRTYPIILAALFAAAIAAICVLVPALSCISELREELSDVTWDLHRSLQNEFKWHREFRMQVATTRAVEKERDALRALVIQPIVQTAQFGPAACEQAPLESSQVELPEDGDKWFTVLFLSRDWQHFPDQVEARKLWYGQKAGSKWMVELKGQTNARMMYTDEPQFQQFRAKKDGTPLVSGVPTLLIERANGEVVYLESGKNLGRHPRDLRKSIVLEVKRRCPGGQCLPLFPTPPSDTKPNAKPEDEIPTVIQQEPAKDEAQTEDKPVANQKKNGPPAAVALAALAGIFALLALIGRAGLFAQGVRKARRAG